MKNTLGLKLTTMMSSLFHPDLCSGMIAGNNGGFLVGYRKDDFGTLTPPVFPTGEDILRLTINTSTKLFILKFVGDVQLPVSVVHITCDIGTYDLTWDSGDLHYEVPADTALRNFMQSTQGQAEAYCFSTS